MNPARRHRTLAVWTLYCSLLLGLFACGLHHGQMSGLVLSGLGDAFCSGTSDSGSDFDLGDAEQPAGQLPMDCPLCSSFTASLALNATGWSLALPAAVRQPWLSEHWAQPPPRFLRPALNPRASPLSFLA